MSKTPKRYLQSLVRQQVLVGSAGLWEILLTIKHVLENQIIVFLVGAEEINL